MAVETTEANPQPASLPPCASNGHWNVVAAAVGALTYLLVLYRFQTYTERNNTPAQTFMLFAAIIFLLSCGLGLVVPASPGRAVAFLVLGIFAAHSAVIWVDWQEDPTNHNLLPFEFVYYFVLCCPGY